MKLTEYKSILLIIDNLIEKESVISSFGGLNFQNLAVIEQKNATVEISKYLHFNLIIIELKDGKEADGLSLAGFLIKITKLPILFLASQLTSNVIAQLKDIEHYGFLIKYSNVYLIQSSIQSALIMFSIKSLQAEEIKLLSSAPEAISTEKESTFKTIFEKHNAIMLLIDPETGRIKEANQSAANFYGYTMEKLTSMNINDINSMGPLEINIEIQKAVTENRNYFIFPHKISNGEIRIVEVHSSPILFQDKLVLFSIIHDITDRKLKEQEVLRLSIERKTILDNIGNGVFMITKDRGVLWANKRAAEIYGYALDEIVGDSTSKFYKDIESFHHVGMESFNCLSRGDIYSREVEQVKKTGERIWCFLIGQAINPENLDEGTIWISEDITKRKLNELALKESETKFRTVADFTYNWEYWQSENQDIVYMSPSCKRLKGYEVEEFIANPKLLQEIIHPDDLEMMNVHNFASHHYEQRDQINEIDFRIIDRNEITRYVHHICRPVYNEKGEYIGRRVSNIDITERMRNEQLIQIKNSELTNLNATKDKFFSIIAHDLKSPFNGFLGMTQMMVKKSEYMTIDEYREIGNEIHQSANNLYKLLENLLTWSRVQRGSIEFTPVRQNLKTLVERCMTVLNEGFTQKQIRKIISIPDELEVYADIRMLETIVRNLLTNSIKFTKPGGMVELSAEKREKDILIAVRDTGIGMAPAIQENLFRIDKKITRPGTNGESSTGLGLFLCKEFVDKHSGKIWVESECQQGSTFYFTIMTLRSENSKDSP
ncbi:MAG: PAS domain-containing sensor histidine kinase [Leptospiraceae bacterium]|nr:PAS domain-containing sensor histidine kinase [Leptospiraceae bacterium]MCP5511161.1 PAS domain-containing sensor histidine kinase [Leptospiraceae bacterium]